MGAIFGMMFALGLYLAYLRQIDAAAAFYGCLAVGLGAAVGGAGGLVAGRPVDATYWAALCAALGYVATAGEATEGIAFHFAWANVGAAAGTGAHLVGRHRPVLSVCAAGAAAGLAMLAYLWISHQSVLAEQFDAICAPIVGALIGVLIVILQYLEADRRLPRYTIATWLLCAVLVGNLAVDWILY